MCRVWSSRRKKYTPSVSGVEITSSTSENIVLSSTPIWFSAANCTAISQTLILARNKLDLFVTQLAEKEGINEHLKAQDQLAWVGAMNNIRNRAEEIVLKELIYSEDAV